MRMKFKLFLIRIWNFLKKFPVFLLIAIFLPPAIYIGRYMFTAEHIYNNLYYNGESIDGNPENFEITEINPLFKVTDISSFSNYQGGACYKNYYALCSNNYECLLIYDMTKNKVVHTIYTNDTNTDFHCNTMFFGSDFYSASDKFPLLYISQENMPSRCTIVCRLYQNGDTYSIKIIQYIYFESTEEMIYYPNSYYDYNTFTLYYGGYTKNSYMKEADNKLKFYSFPLPDFRLNDVTLNTRDASHSFTIDSETATQGGFVSNGYLYQSFSGLQEAAAPFSKPGEPPKMKIIDLENGEVVKEYNDLTIFGVHDEFENIALSESGRIFAHGNTHLKIYEFKYKI